MCAVRTTGPCSFDPQHADLLLRLAQLLRSALVCLGALRARVVKFLLQKYTIFHRGLEFVLEVIDGGSGDARGILVRKHEAGSLRDQG